MILLLFACITPTGGEYLFELVGDVETDCAAAEDPEANNEPISVTVSADQTYVAWGTSVSGAQCPLDGVSFVCEWSDDVEGSGGLDAVITYAESFDARWVTSKKITGTWSASSTCEGSQCDQIEALGSEFCTSLWDVKGTLQE